MPPPEDQVAPQDSTTGRFLMQKIYLKDVSYEAPNAPAIFQGEWKPDVDLQVNNSARKIAQDHYEVVITTTVTVSVGGQTAYLVEVTQAGMFHLSGFSNDEVKDLLGIDCPSVLFPFVREAVSDLVTKGGFPQLLLAPMNFEVLYRRHQEQEAAGASQ